MITSDLIRIALCDNEFNIINDERVEKLRTILGWEDAEIEDGVLVKEYGLPKMDSIRDAYQHINSIICLFDRDNGTEHVIGCNVVKNDVNGLGQELWMSHFNSTFYSDLREDPDTEELTKAMNGKPTTFEEEVRGLAKSLASMKSLRGKKKDRALGLMCHLFAVSA